MIELPYPEKILWPNGRGHHMAKHRAFQKHKQWAYYARLSIGGPASDCVAAALRLRVIFHPKTRNAVDRDNASASLKAYQDGIAAAIGIDDNRFLEPAISFAEPVKGGKVLIAVETV